MKHLFNALAIALMLSAVGVTLNPNTAVAAETRVYDGAPGAPTIGMIGDSTLAGVRWSDSFDSLNSINYSFNAESCRRTTGDSCRGREGYAPPNALDTLRSRPGQWGSVLVMVTGYNDAGTSFASSVDAIMAEAQLQGIAKVMWLTMRTADVEYVAPTFASDTYTFRDNNRILLQKAEQYGGRLQIADWATFTADKPSWFSSDGVHYQPVGSRGAGQYIAEQAALVHAGADITPDRPPELITSTWATLRRGDRGSGVAAAQRALIGAGTRVFGGADGIFGYYTQSAVLSYQRTVGLSASGAVDRATALRLGLVGGPTTSPSTTIAPPTAPSAASWVNIYVGERSTRAAKAQQALMRSGIFVSGGADGYFGPVSGRALRVYQTREGLSVTGVVDRSSAVALGLIAATTPADPPTPAAWRTLGVGTKRSAAVRTAQQAMIDSGVVVRGGADGWLGTYTAIALRTYQSRNGLPVTGVIDEATAIHFGLYTAPAPASTTSTTTSTTTTTTAPSASSSTTEVTTTEVTTTEVTTTEVTTTTGAPATTVTTAPAATSTSSTAPTEAAPNSEPASTTTTAAMVTVTGRVWNDDATGDSLMGEGSDTFVQAVRVRVIDAAGDEVATGTTEADGSFELFVSAAGTYRVEFEPLSGTEFVLADVGDDDSIDSDVDSVDPLTGFGVSEAANYALGDSVVVDAGLLTLA